MGCYRLMCLQASACNSISVYKHHLWKQRQSKHQGQKEPKRLWRGGRAGQRKEPPLPRGHSENVCRILSKHPVAFGSLLCRAMSWPVFGERLADKVVLSLMYTVVFEYPAKFLSKPGAHGKGGWRGRFGEVSYRGQNLPEAVVRQLSESGNKSVPARVA